MAQFIDPNQIVQPLSQIMVLNALKTMATSMTAVFMGKTEEVPSRKRPSTLRIINVAKLNVAYAQVMEEGRKVIKRMEAGGELSTEAQMLPRQYTLLKRIADEPTGRITPPAFAETIESMQDLYVLQSLDYIYVSWRQA